MEDYLVTSPDANFVYVIQRNSKQIFFAVVFVLHYKVPIGSALHVPHSCCLREQRGQLRKYIFEIMWQTKGPS